MGGTAVNQAVEDVEEAVKRAIAEHRGMTPRELAPQARLLDDLGVDGDDAEELLSDIARRFDVDFSRLHFDRHFGPEGLSILRVMKDTVKPWRCYPLTVEDLVGAAKSGTFVYDYDHRPFVQRRPWHVWVMGLGLAAVVFAVMQILN